MKVWHIAAVAVILGVVYVLVKQQQKTTTVVNSGKTPAGTNDVLVSGFSFLTGLTKIFADSADREGVPGPGTGNYVYPGTPYTTDYGTNFGDV